MAIEKVSHTRDENGDDVQEVVTLRMSNLRRIYIKRHGKFQGREIYYEDAVGKSGMRCEIFTFDQEHWNEVVSMPLGVQ